MEQLATGLVGGLALARRSRGLAPGQCCIWAPRGLTARRRLAQLVSLRGTIARVASTGESLVRCR
jgi:hypothetical protein